MRTLINYIPLLLCPAMMVACIAGPRLLGRKSAGPEASSPSATPALRDAQAGGSESEVSELAELQEEVARLRSMVTPTTAAAGLRDAPSTQAGVQRG